MKTLREPSLWHSDLGHLPPVNCGSWASFGSGFLNANATPFQSAISLVQEGRFELPSR